MSKAVENVIPSDILFIRFNQNNTSLNLGTKSGYKLISFESLDKLRVCHEEEQENISIVERLFCASMVAFVSLNSPRKLVVFHFKTTQEIQSLSYANTVLAVKLNRQRMIVVVEDAIFIHRMSDFVMIHVIRDTPLNKTGLVALTSENNYMAYPGSVTSGELIIFDLIHFKNKIVIAAHDNPLAAITFNVSGSKIATASEKGTVIRVFAVRDGQLLFEFRRGYARCVSISNLSFSDDSKLLAACSNTQTVHIFKLEDPNMVSEKEVEEQGWMSYFNTALINTVEYLPTNIGEFMRQWRSFATAMLPFASIGNSVAITKLQGEYRVLVASVDGYLYIYNLDLESGGDCTLLKQHKLSDLVVEEDDTGFISYAAIVRKEKPSIAQMIYSDDEVFPEPDVLHKYDGEFPPISA